MISLIEAMRLSENLNEIDGISLDSILVNIGDGEVVTLEDLFAEWEIEI